MVPLRFYSLILPTLMMRMQMRPDTERKLVHTDSILCKTCRSALEYFAYIMEESRSNRSQASVVTHHRDLYSLRDSEHSNCHFCVFLASQFDGIRIKESLFESFHSNHQIELCWAFEPGALDDQRFPGYARINFALTNSAIERTSRSYPKFIRLQLWPADDFSYLFDLTPEIRVLST